MKSEKVVQTEILNYLKSIGAYSIKVVVANRKGVSDITCCVRGRYVAIEVKAENKDFRDVTKLQRLELSRCNDAGGLGFYANNLNYVEKILNYYILDDFLM
ncbi:hypothetical protein [Sulfurimonas sp.]|uniref:hypothetical protein n=1 Tax=Sulfurimonas sp. TaxID=2022749 RepID=UPI003569D896